MQIVFAVICGVLFGFGLIIAGMTDSTKVLGFLDIFGQWNPSLIFVMVGGIAIAAIPFRFAMARRYSILNLSMQIPSNRHIDGRLIGGSLLFGIGWGIAGLCPGPALVIFGSGSGKGSLFFIAMLTGMAIFELLEKKWHSPALH
jgi:uncharacterized membrane protein YedE/YeeE